MALTHRKKTVLENRERLKPIVESIIFLGRQNIPLRGNFDSGKLFNEEDSNLQSQSLQLLIKVIFVNY